MLVLAAELNSGAVPRVIGFFAQFLPQSPQSSSLYLFFLFFITIFACLRAPPNSSDSLQRSPGVHHISEVIFLFLQNRTQLQIGLEFLTQKPTESAW